MRRLLTLLTLIALVVLLPTACQTDTPEEADEVGEAASREAPSEEEDASGKETAEGVFAYEEPVSGGTLVIGQGQEPDTLYFYGGSMLASRHVLNSIYDGPIEGLDYDFQAVTIESLPKIEEEGSGAILELVSVEAGDRYVDPESQEVVTATESIDELQQLTAKFTIVEGLTWEDGEPVTAEDSVFSQELACDPDTPTSKYTCERTAHYIALDDRTVEWKGLPGFTDQTYYANFYTPMPRHYVGAGDTRMDETEPADILQDEAFARKPLSFGPFKIVEWQSDHITLDRNEYYWRSEEGLPFLDSIIHKFIPDSNTLLASLKTGEIDVATQDGLDISQFDPMTAAEEAGEIVPYYVVGTVWEHIDFNLDPVDERVSPGACLEVRKAMTLGTDRETMVEVIQQGKTRVQHTFVPEEHWAFPEGEDLVTYEFDAEAAERMLADAGFVDLDGNGIREAEDDITCTIVTDLEGNTKDQLIPAGTPLEFSLNTTAGNIMRQDTTLLFQQNMENIGVQVDLEYLDANVYFADGPDGPLFGRRFDLGEFAWLTGVQPPVSLYYCTEIPAEENNWGGQNETGWCDPEYDRLGKSAETTLERDEALPLYSDAQKMFMENLPVMPLFARVKVMATRTNVVNFAPNPTVNSETWNVEVWGFNEQQ